MKTIHLAVTEECNLKCPYCFIKKEGIFDLSTNFWLKVIDLCSGLDQIHFLITGGEPLLRKDIIEILSAARRKGICQLYTNATIDIKEFAKVVENIDLIRISVDGSSDLIYGKTRIASLFKNVLKNIEEVQRLDIPITIQINLNKENRSSIEQTIRFFESFGIQRIIISPELKFNANNNEIKFIKSQYKNISFLSNHFDSVIDKPQVGFQFPETSRIKGSTCGVFNDRFYITPDGFLAGCPLLCDSSYKYVDLKEIVFRGGDIFQAFEFASNTWDEKRRKSQCLSCTFLDLCGGWCPGVRGGSEKGCLDYLVDKQTDYG